MVAMAAVHLRDPVTSTWQSDHVFKMPLWVEPTLIVSILVTSMFFTRRKNYSILRSPHNYERLGPASPHPSSPRSSSDSDLSPPTPGLISPGTQSYPPKRRRVLGLFVVRTPNSSRFAHHFHSRILQKFPFLIEMFYWVITYFFYRLTAVVSRAWHGGTETLWELAQTHAIDVLDTESYLSGYTSMDGTARWAEWRIQQWFLVGATNGDWREVWLTVLNRCYALIHIPGTVGFIAYYYATAPTHARFTLVRRTMSLVNLFAFLIFLGYPCMPPRLLPAEYGFVDTVNAEDAQSVWMQGKYVNKLAAMPSMHFGYAFCIGCVFVGESGVLKSLEALLFAGRKMPWARSDSEIASESDFYEATREDEIIHHRPVWTRMLFLAVGIFYPSWILLTIVATGNHYFLDAAVATLIVLMAYLSNRVLLSFLPLEDWLLWILRLEKPTPTTGRREQRKQNKS